MFLLIWLVSVSIVSLFSPAYGEPIHLPLIRQVLSHSNSAVSRSLLGVERRNTVDDGLSFALEQYLIPISFGTPTQIVPLVLSFNVPGTMVVGCNLDSKSCSSSVGPETLFNYSDSSSAQNKSTSMQTITPLGTDPIPGSVFTDVIGFGPFSVLDASFFVIQVYFGGIAGAFGLGFPSASFQNLPSIWQSLLSTNPVDAPEMGIWLSRLHNTSGLGVFTFGGTNSSLYTGDIEFLNSTSTSFWALNITTLTIQGRELTLTQSRNNTVSFDVATAAIYGPMSSVAAIWAQVPGAGLLSPGNYQYPCSTTLNVSVSFGGRSWTFDPAELNGGTVAALKTYGDNDTQCLGVISGADQPDWSFGQPFLRGVYTVLRQGNPPAVGFAELSEQGGGAPSPTLPSAAPSGSASSPPSSIVTPQSSTPPQVSAKKSAVAVVVGGVVGGLVLCAALLAAVFLTHRRRRQDHPILMDEDEGGVNRDLTPEPFVAVDQRPEMAPLNSAERRFKKKLQANGASLSYPYWIDAGPSPATQPSKSASGGENGSSPSPTAAADISVMEQLRNLTEEVRQLTECDPGGSGPMTPPCYHPKL